jgi:hypothetical protein
MFAASVLTTTYVADTFATALPAERYAGQQVLNNAETGASKNQIFDYCKKQNIPLTPVANLKGNNEFCVLAYTASVTDKAIRKTGYSTKDTITKMGGGSEVYNRAGMGFEIYRRAGMDELLMPFYALAEFPEGQRFLVKTGMMRESDVSVFNSIVATEKNTQAQKNKPADPDCVRRQIAQLQGVAGQLAPSMAEMWCKNNGNK